MKNKNELDHNGQSGKGTEGQRSSGVKVSVITIIISVVISLGGAAGASFFFTKQFAPRIAYLNTGRLMIGFSEANKIEREVKAEDDKWQAQYKILNDSLQAQIDNVSKEFNSATPAKKKELQDMLAARSQQANNFKQANIRKINDLRQNKMQSVFDKANVYMSEYGKKHRYSMIFGTVAGGSILYGNEKGYDITDEVVRGLNERYK